MHSLYLDADVLKSKTGSVGLSAQLALHTGASEWSYEVPMPVSDHKDGS
jgi:hypothetical protein